MMKKLANLVTVIGILGTCTCLDKLYNYLYDFLNLWGGKH